MTSWLRELRQADYVLDMPDDVATGHGTIVITPDALHSIDEYAHSTPTGPSAGRVYRRNHRDPDGVPDMPYVFVVVDAPNGEGQLHVPCRALVQDNDGRERDGSRPVGASPRRPIRATGQAVVPRCLRTVPVDQRARLEAQGPSRARQRQAQR